ncbi:hypothetical protein DHEL01_v207609 [Diaporthe helianthi]|uniref:Uncharacterized protein n=1 Tax=Diaporthe helianthi TaxID=158607 RepID=A0A2P5HUT2_DIAHE|nr:hypothetical protein DHEL01_v207609 [Diaporthe helianthi]
MLDSLSTWRSQKEVRSSQSARKSSLTPPPRRSQATTDATKLVPHYLGDRIPSSPGEGDTRKPRRRQAVEESLIHLTATKHPNPRYIRDDNECFKLESVARFCKDYDIELDGNRWDNFKRLLSGCQDLPFIILQNPTNAHIYEYDEMKKCPTIQWISDVLAEIGLTLEDVVIVDICSLLSDHDLRQLSDEGSEEEGLKRRFDAIERSYGMVEDILKVLKPSVLISCQCASLNNMRTRVGRRLATTDNMLARCLCSNEADAKRGLTSTIQIGSANSLMVYGVHPRRLSHKELMIPVLRGTFKDVFEPYMNWFKREEGKVQIAEGKEIEERRKDANKPVVAVQEKTGLQKFPLVVVTEVDGDETGLGEQLSTLKLQEVD